MDRSVTTDPRSRAADRAAAHARYLAEGLHSAESLGELVTAGSRRSPDSRITFLSRSRPAVATLGEIDRRAAAVARGLLDRGLRPGDVVVSQLPSWVEGTVLTAAAMLAGLVVVPVTHIHGPAELGYVLRDSRAKAFAMPDRWGRIDYLQRWAEMGPTPDLELLVVVGETLPAGASSFDEIERAGSTSDTPLPRVDPVAAAFRLYTSGTTAEPKGVVHSHQGMAAELRHGTASLAGEGPHLPLFCFPAGHMGGLLACLTPLVGGSAAVAIDQWDTELVVEAIPRLGVTRSAAAPFHLTALLQAAEEHEGLLAGVRHFSCGGAGVPPVLIERAMAAGVVASRSYGSTEHPTVTGGYRDDGLADRSRTDGRLLRGNEIRIVDGDGVDLPPDEPGEIVTRGPELMLGYSREDLDEVAFLPGGWFRTGDIGVLDDRGFLTVTDRLKDIIIRGGENISSQEVEQLLLSSHPQVRDVAVVAMPDERYGEKVCAYVVLEPGASLTLAEVKDAVVASGAAVQKTPERLVVVDDFPRTTSGKVQKAELRARLAEPGGGAR